MEVRAKQGSSRLMAKAALKRRSRLSLRCPKRPRLSAVARLAGALFLVHFTLAHGRTPRRKHAHQVLFPLRVADRRDFGSP